jgi:hypothetical protein
LKPEEQLFLKQVLAFLPAVMELLFEPNNSITTGELLGIDACREAI